MIVADTNLITYFYVSSDRSGRAEAVRQRDPLWVAPRLWQSEFRHVLVRLVRHGLGLDAALRIAAEAEATMAGREYTVLTDEVLELAAASGCSAYDCEFVALAMRLGVPLVTDDRRVLRAFPSVALSPDAFVG